MKVLIAGVPLSYYVVSGAIVWAFYGLVLPWIKNHMRLRAEEERRKAEEERQKAAAHEAGRPVRDAVEMILRLWIEDRANWKLNTEGYWEHKTGVLIGQDGSFVKYGELYKHANSEWRDQFRAVVDSEKQVRIKACVDELAEKILGRDK